MMPSLQAWWHAVFWVALMIAAWAALRPIAAEEWFSGQDKVLHLATYTGLYLSGRLAFHDALWRLPVALLAYGVAIELLQSLTPSRTMSFADVVANTLGLALGILLLGMVQRRWPQLWMAMSQSETGCR